MGRHRQILSVLIVLLTVTLGACRQETVVPALPIDDDAPIRTDNERYTPEDFGDYVRYTLETTYTNTTGRGVYLIPCGFDPPLYGLERFDGETWRASGYSLACPAVPAPTVEVSPGESFSATLDLSAFRSPNAFPQLGTYLVPGVHRLVFLISSEPSEEGLRDQDDLLPLEQRVSNAFELEAP
jgi:hypothetical protein